MIDPLSWEFSWPYILAIFSGAYLIGSVPFGLMLARWFGAGDIRTIGSGNIGATNVLRTGRKALAAATLVLDVVKAAAAVLLANMYGPDMAIVGSAGVIIGHVFPVWIKFKGGKGVSTSLGVIAVLSWPVGLIAFFTWLLVLMTTRLSSLAALIATAATPPAMYYFADPQSTEFSVALVTLVWLRHWGNIKRLIRGEESRVGRNRQKPQ